MHRRALALLAALLSPIGCASDPPITVTEGAVRQVEWLTSLPVSPRDLVLVVDDRDGSLREQVRTALSAQMNDLVVPGGSWDAVDIQAWLVGVGSRSVVGPKDDPRLAWKEGDASRAGVNEFVDAVMDHWPAASTSDDGVIDTMRFALDAIPLREYAEHDGILVSGRDDPHATRETFRGREDQSLGIARFTIFQPGGTRMHGCGQPTWQLTSMADPSIAGVSLSFVSCELPFEQVGTCGLRGCPPTPKRAADGTPECRVRAIPRKVGLSCEAVRGWTPSTFPVVPLDTYDDAKDLVICDVQMLTGEDGRRCRNLDDTCEGCASGWCLPDLQPTRRQICETEEIRFIGGAAADATIEIVCNRP